MKRLFVLLMVLLSTGISHAAISCFANTHMSYDFLGGPYTSPEVDTTGADLIIAISAVYVDNGLVYDNQGNKWQYAGLPPNLQNFVYFTSAPKTSQHHTFSLEFGANRYDTYGQYQVSQVYVCSGSDTVHPVGAQNAAQNITAASFNTGSVSYNAGDMIVTGAARLSSTNPTAISAPFNTPVSLTSASTMTFSTSYFIATSSGTVNPTWTAADGSPAWSTNIVVFRAATDTPLPNASPFIYTVAGNGSHAIFAQSGQNALLGSIGGWPGEMKFDTNGNLIFADVNDNFILGLNTSVFTRNILGVSTCAGCLRILAGTGPPGCSGYGGSPLSAQMTHPVGIAIVPPGGVGAGDVLIADQQCSTIDRIKADGSQFTRNAGGGPGGSTGSCGSDAGDNDNVPYANSLLNCTQGVAVDAAGNVYVSDYTNGKLKVVNMQSTTQTIMGQSIPAGYIKTVASLINGLLGVVLDSSGNAYVAAYAQHQIIKVNTSGVKTVFAGTGTPGYSGDGGLATAAQLNSPFDVGIDPSGNIFITDTLNNAIRKVDASTGIITTVVGDNSIYYSGVDGGIGAYGGDGSSAKNAGLNYPIGVAISAAGNIFIGDLYNYVVRETRIPPPPAFGSLLQGTQSTGNMVWQ